MKSPHAINNRVRFYRVVAEMTQQELADRVGVTRQTILSIEKGKYSPSVALALCIEEVFETNVENLFQLNKGESHD